MSVTGGPLPDVSNRGINPHVRHLQPLYVVISLDRLLVIVLGASFAAAILGVLRPFRLDGAATPLPDVRSLAPHVAAAFLVRSDYFLGKNSSRNLCIVSRETVSKLACLQDILVTTTHLANSNVTLLYTNQSSKE
jgi:hypothetical protein